MRLFASSDEKVKNAKEKLSEELLGKHGINCVGVRDNEKNHPFVSIGVNEPGKVKEARLAVGKLMKSGKVDPVLFEVTCVGKIEIQQSPVAQI